MNAPAKIYSFTDREVTHPGDPPGDRIDAQFENHAAAIQSTNAALAQIRRSDGGLANGIVTKDSLASDLFDDIKADITSEATALRNQARAAALDAQADHLAADASATIASQAAAAVTAAAATIEGARDASLQALVTLAGNATASFNQVIAAQAAVDNSQNDAAKAAAVAEDWAVASMDWAEYMPGPIPPNTLAVMGITGDHWSARWWANYMDQKIALWEDEYGVALPNLDEFNDLYLGAKDTPPALDNDGDPLQPGAMYWNTTSNVMFVWTGSAWSSMAGGGEINVGENLGGGYGVYAQKAGPNLQFKSLRFSTAFSITATSTEIQVALSNVPWGIISGAPTTLAGYGITDAYTKSQIDTSQAAQDNAIALKADKSYVDAQDNALAAYIDAQNAAQDAALSGSIGLKVDKTDDTGAAKIPAGTTGQRPTTSLAGYLRYNSTTSKFEGHNGTAWGTIGGGAAIGTSPPALAQPGDFWWSSDLGQLFIYYNDGDSSQWVSTTPALTSSLFLPLTGGTVTGDLAVAGATTLGKTYIGPGGDIEVGAGQVTNTASYIDLHATPGGDYEARLIRNAGANGLTQLLHKGTGALQLVAETAGSLIEFFVTGTKMLYMNIAVGVVATRRVYIAPGIASSSSDVNSGLEVQNNGGTGDSDVAAINLQAGSYGNKIITRQDGYWGVGGNSRSAWGLYLDPSNNLVAAGNVTSASDPRLKDQVERIPDAYSLLEGVHGYHFVWNDRSSLYAEKAGRPDLGLMADEVNRTMPQILGKTVEDPVTGEVYDTVAYEKVIPVLVEIIHKQQTRINAIEDRLKQLDMWGR